MEAALQVHRSRLTDIMLDVVPDVEWSFAVNLIIDVYLDPDVIVTHMEFTEDTDAVHARYVSYTSKANYTNYLMRLSMLRDIPSNRIMLNVNGEESWLAAFVEKSALVGGVRHDPPWSYGSFTYAFTHKAMDRSNTIEFTGTYSWRNFLRQRETVRSTMTFSKYRKEFRITKPNVRSFKELAYSFAFFRNITWFDWYDGDFRGYGRSYEPIPEAELQEELSRHHVHAVGEVDAEVYRKYPELVARWYSLHRTFVCFRNACIDDRR